MPKARNKTNKSSTTAIMQRHDRQLPPRQHEPGTKPTLIIDGMNIAYHAFYAYSKLSYGGKSTSVLFGFPQILKSILQTYNPSRVIVCWDGCKHEVRYNACPGYKSHRDIAKSRVVNKQIPMLRKLLHRMGIAQAYNPAMEGDDMIYWVWKRMKVMSKVIIVSGDKDFKQLIDWDTQVYNPRTKYIEGVFAFSANNYGLDIMQYVDFLSLVGDNSDDIPGLRGIGEQRASAFLLKFGSIKNYLDSDADYPGMVDKDAVRKVWKTNRLLIDLKWFNKRHWDSKGILWFRNSTLPDFNLDKYRAICLRYGLTTMVFPKFIESFKDIV